MLEAGFISHRNEVETTNTSSKIFFLNTDLNFKYTFKNTARDEAFSSDFIVRLQLRKTPSSHKGRKIVNRVEILGKLIYWSQAEEI